MALNVAVQMDPIERINIRGDSTFALLLEAQARGHALAYYTPDRLAMRGDRVFATVQPLEVRDEPGDHFTLGRGEAHRAYRRSTWCCCGRIRRSTSPTSPPRTCSSASIPKTLVVNDPAQVRNAPEKMFVMEFSELMPPTLITRDLAEIKAFRAEHGDIVMKPLYGNGGGAVFRLTRDDLNFGSLYDLFAATFREQWVVQKFLPAVKHGDKRIILVDGEFAGAVNRVPAAAHPALSQNNRRTRSRSCTGRPAIGASTSWRRYRLCTRRDGCPHRGHADSSTRSRASTTTPAPQSVTVSMTSEPRCGRRTSRSHSGDLAAVRPQTSDDTPRCRSRKVRQSHVRNWLWRTLRDHSPACHSIGA